LTYGDEGKISEEFTRGTKRSIDVAKMYKRKELSE